MKFIIVPAFCIALVSFLTIQKNTYPHFKDDPCKAILDSARVMVENGEMTIRWEQRAANYERFNSVSRWIDGRPFAELKCLIGSDHPLYRMYGYLYATMQYLDSVDNYSYILKDTTSLQMIGDNGIEDAHITIGEYLTKVHEGMKKENEDWAKKPELEGRVKSFIKQYARYPEIYQPISFPFFSLGSETGRRRTDFRLRHVYKIKNNRRQMEKVMSEFVFDEKLNINVIARDSSNTVFSIPPMIGDWLKTYGRHLTKKDSVVLLLK